MLGIQSKTTKRPDPQVGVQLPVVVPQPKSQPVGGTKLERVSDAYSQTFLAAILPELSAFVRTIGVDVKIPITTDDVDLKHYEFGFVGNDPKAFLYLKTGDRFVYQHGHVTDFEAHDSYRRPEPNKLPEDKPVEQFFGTINMTETESLSLARKAINDLGYAAKIPQLKKKPEVVAPRKYGTNYFARYFFNWWPNDEGIQIAVIEVDATAKKLKAFYINDRISTNIWREPPKIDVPISPPDSLK